VKTLLGTVSVAVNFVGYIPYFRDVLQKKTKPHIFTWLVWCVLAGIAFAVQLTNNAGPGSWVMGFTTFATLTILLLALRGGEKGIVLADWISLAVAGIALLLWFFTKDPLLAIILITGADVAGGFFPTFRKSYYRPREETVSLYAWYALSWTLSLLALERFDFVNAFAPAVFIVLNGGLVVFLTVRRVQLTHESPSEDVRR
jgi:hypothetical protein